MKIINSKLALHKSGYMKTKTIIYTFLLLLVLSVQRCQCKKDDPIPTPTPVDYRPNTIFGKVVDKTTGQGLPNARVYFQKAKNVILGSPSFYIADSQYSDSSGNFSFTAIPNSDSVYSIYCTKDLFFDDGNNQILLASYQIGFSTYVKLEPMAWLKFHTKNVNPVNINDEIYFLPNIGSGKSFVGSNIDTFTTFLAYGNVSNRFIITISKNGLQKKIDTIFNTLSMDTTLINIFY